MSRRGTLAEDAARSDASAEGRWPRLLRAPIFGGAIAALGFLAFLWPFVRSPSPGVVAADLYLLGAWACFVVMLAGIARAVRPDVPGERQDDHA